MWPKRKPKNRRNERESTLDVRARSRAAKPGHFRAIATAIGLVGSTALGALLLWQAYRWALQRFVYENEAYTIRRIEFRHPGRIRSDQVLLWTGITPGQNLLAVDLDQVRHHLLSYPWIESAEAEALRPDCLRISIREREPVAQLIQWRLNRADGRFWKETNFVDQLGYVLPPLRPEYLRPGANANFAHLTQLTGLDGTNVTSGDNLDHPRLKTALSLIRTYEDSGLYAQVDLDELSLSQPDILVGKLRHGTEILFGLSAFDRQLARWQAIQDFAVRTNRDLAWLDLSVTNNIPARWVPAPATNAPARTPLPSPKPPRPNRRHV